MPCQEPLFPEPHAPKGRQALRGDRGVTPGPPSSLGAAPSPEPALMLPTAGDAAGGPASADPFCILE